MWSLTFVGNWSLSKLGHGGWLSRPQTQSILIQKMVIAVLACSHVRHYVGDYFISTQVTRTMLNIIIKFTLGHDLRLLHQQVLCSDVAVAQLPAKANVE